MIRTIYTLSIVGVCWSVRINDIENSQVYDVEQDGKANASNISELLRTVDELTAMSLMSQSASTQQDMESSLASIGFKSTWEMPGFDTPTSSMEASASVNSKVRSSPQKLSSVNSLVRINDKSLLVLGMVGTVDDKCSPAIQSLAQLCTWFDPGKCRIIVGHAGANPEVKSLLERNYPDVVEFQKDPPDLLSKAGARKRTWLYAVIRNALLETGLARNYTYLMPADLDGIVSFDSHIFGAITSSMTEEHDHKWDAVSFVNLNRYYDWWAARCTLESPNCWAHKPPVCFDIDYFQCFKDAREEKALVFRQVASAFNGFALYKSQQIGTCRYDGHHTPGRPNEEAWTPESSDMGGQDCEHVAFNNCLTRSGRRFMLNSIPY